MSKLWTETAAGPASYSTGGFVITTTLATVDSFEVSIATAGAVLGQVDFDYALNTPAAGQVTVKVLRKVYDKLTSIGAMSGLPSGVTSRGTSGGTYDTEAAHVHSLAHDHAAVTSDASNNSGSGVTNEISGANSSAHTHSFDPPNHTGDTTAPTATHDHAWSNIYEHAHSVTNTATDGTVSEIANGTDLSGASLVFLGVDD